MINLLITAFGFDTSESSVIEISERYLFLDLMNEFTVNPTKETK
ncbi:hypothetical protein V7S76_09340 [Aquirufa sp. ROCK2-A2]